MAEPNQSYGIFAEDDAAAHARVDAQIRQMAPVDSLSLRQQIALSCRLLWQEGHATTLAGQITVRDGSGHFWTTNWGDGFADVTESSVVLIDEDMNVIEGQGLPNPGVRFHLWIYRRKPRLSAIVHTHSPYASALSMTGEELIVSHMDAAMFYEDCAYLPEWPGVPVANEEGQIISGALAEKNSILLAHHGLLTSGVSLDEALYRAIQLERACRLQLLARAVGPVKPLPHERAVEAQRFMMKPGLVTATTQYWMRQALKAFPDAIR